MKISVLITLAMAPLVLMSFTSCASVEEEGSMPDYPEPNRADHAAELQDAHSKFLRNQL